MAYEKQKWLDRQVEYPNRYVDQNNNILNLTRSPGKVTENGSLLNAERMNHIENGIKDIDDKMAFFTESATLNDLVIKSNFLGNNSKINASEISVVNDGKAENLDNRLKAMGLKKLWENPNQTSAFNSQNIELSSNDYDYLIWIYKLHIAGSNNKQKSQLTLKGAGSIMDIAHDYSPGSNTYYMAEYYRTATYVNDTSFLIADNFVRYNSGSTFATNNNYNIPVAIFGAKF